MRHSTDSIQAPTAARTHAGSWIPGSRRALLAILYSGIAAAFFYACDTVPTGPSSDKVVDIRPAALDEDTLCAGGQGSCRELTSSEADEATNAIASHFNPYGDNEACPDLENNEDAFDGGNYGGFVTGYVRVDSLMQNHPELTDDDGYHTDWHSWPDIGIRPQMFGQSGFQARINLATIVLHEALHHIGYDDSVVDEIIEACWIW